MPQLGDITHGTKLGLKNRGAYIWYACQVCKKERWVKVKFGKPLYERCPSCNKRGNHYRWEGGYIHKGDGYWQVRIYPDNPYYIMANKKGYVLEHRLVMANFLGRPLKQHESVHHKDGNHKNNNVKNLQLRTGIHGKGIKLICGDCGSVNIKGVNL